MYGRGIVSRTLIFSGIKKKFGQGRVIKGCGVGNRDRQLKGLVAPSGAVRQILALLESYSAQGEQWFSCASETRFHFAPRRGLPPLRRTYRKCPAFSDVKNASITASMAVLISRKRFAFSTPRRRRRDWGGALRAHENPWFSGCQTESEHVA